MKPKRVMLIAGEASGDALAADLVRHLGVFLAGEPPEFFGAGGPQMAEAGVKLTVDMTQHAVTGLSDVIKKYGEFKKIFTRLQQLAIERKPDVMILVDFGGFNLRFATAMRRYLNKHPGSFRPQIVQFVSPQVWASRAGRAQTLEQNVDLLLCLFPFEKDWYARNAPKLRVEFVGHPILDRHAGRALPTAPDASQPPLMLLLPGSRSGELKRHLPVMIPAAEKIRSGRTVRLRMILPNQRLAEEAKALIPDLPRLVEMRIGDLTPSLAEASLAIASTGTVLLECAYFGVPTVAMYKTSWGTYQIGKRLAKVRFLAMPNILADQEIFPEFIQDKATPENIARAGAELLGDAQKRDSIKTNLANIVRSLGEPGAGQRAARAVLNLMAS